MDEKSYKNEQGDQDRINALKLLDDFKGNFKN